MYELFQDYQTKGDENAWKDGNGGSTSNIDKSESGLFDDYSSYVADDNSTSGGIVLELDHYLEEKVCSPELDLDILAWWKTSGVSHRGAGSTIFVCDSVGSTIGNLWFYSAVHYICFCSCKFPTVSPHHSRLHPNTLEALMCAQSWLLNEIR
ncbi:hypothetical protein OSB04_017020, partial [Centaurea solstitialis]